MCIHSRSATFSLSAVFGVTGAGAGCGPALGGDSVGRPDGVPHHEGGGGRRVGGLEHQRLHLRLHPHQRHGGAHPHAGERYLGPPVHHRHALRWPAGPRHLRSVQEALREGSHLGAILEV